MDGTFGSRDLRELHEMMQLVERLAKMAADKDIRLPKDDEARLVKLMGDCHRMVYTIK